jgi:transcriptional regulator GlxA family with amidase domain
VRSALLEAVADAVGDNSRLESTLSLSAQELVFSQATELIHKSTTPITVLELAQGAGVGIRALEYAFREVMKTTPSAYLRLHRLNRVRQDLLAADPQVNTVTEVASRWGFAHPGRFSVGYRALFREKPSETLRKPTYMKTSRYLVPAKSAV